MAHIKLIPGLQMWERACKIIPGGNGLLSKRPERYGPDFWPTYFTEAKGIRIRDLQGKEFIDMAQMGLGSSILGYACAELDESVKRAIDSGINCTLNAPEEVLLAEKLLELNSFAKAVRFARGGGEAMAVAIRIARAASGRSKVIFSGYHGWMDWYLAANLSDVSSLSEHLLPGLEPLGVPSNLAGTSFPVRYNDCADLERLMSANNDIGVICIEGARYDFATVEFLALIERYRKERDIIVVFDEITSGLRVTDSGVYKLYNFEPDIAVFGKALGGGYAISAILLGERTCAVAGHTFLSSTMWTERVGLTAGLTTLSILQREKAWVHLDKIGREIEAGWLEAAAATGFKISTTDVKPLITMKPEYGENNDAIKTLFTKYMLNRGYLAATSVYVSMAHNSSVVRDYIGAVKETFQLCVEAIDSNDLKDSLAGRSRSDNFARLT